jgi:hypothetical protein
MADRRNIGLLDRPGVTTMAAGLSAGMKDTR